MHSAHLPQPSESPSCTSPSLHNSPSSESIGSARCCSFPSISAGRYFRARRSSSSGSVSSSEEHDALANEPETEKHICNKIAPIVVETMRWTATPETFVVREDATFTVTCTVVQPVAKNGLAIFRRSKSPALSSSEARNVDAGKKKVDLGNYDDAVRVVDKPSEAQWGNIFTASHASGGTEVLADGQAQMQQEPVTRQSFLVDHANDRLMIPQVDVGIAYHVREHYELVGAKESQSQVTSDVSSCSTSSVCSLQFD